jgi:hypothetical protein
MAEVYVAPAVAGTARTAASAAVSAAVRRALKPVMGSPPLREIE